VELGYVITKHDAARDTDQEIAVFHAFATTIDQEVWPEDPITPLAEAIAAHRAVPMRMRRTAIRAWAPDGTLAGSVQLAIDPEHDDNPEVLDCSVWVALAHRRRGVGRALLAEVVAVARADGRTRLIGSTFSRVPAGEMFARSTGAKDGSRSHTNQLLIADVDRDLLESWVEDGPRRAPDYELIGWDGPIPEEHLRAFADLVPVMNDAPRDGLDLNDFTATPAELREKDDVLAALGWQRWTLVARRRSDGALAGLHIVNWMPELPRTVFVWSTGVRAEHRGHALGKWLKAAMTLRILDERTDVADIRTDNADSNDAMLGINREMGYRPMVATTTWELTVDQAARWIEDEERRIST
jgi:mycothiol synthase